MYENHTCHPFHLFLYVNVVLELLLPDVVIYSSHVSSNVVVISSITPIMNYFSFFGLKGTWCVTTFGIVTPKCLVFPLINFWGLISSLIFLSTSIFSQSQICFSFFPWSMDIPLMLISYYPKHVITLLWSSLVLFGFFWVSTILFFITTYSSWNMYLNSHSWTNNEWYVFFLVLLFRIHLHLLLHFCSLCN